MPDSFLLLDDGTYQCQPFNPFSWQNHSFGTRHKNPQPSVTLRQIHSGIVWNAAGLTDRQQEGDALITNERGRAIGVRTADCVPILLLDAKRRAGAAIHAGWRGTAAEIATRTIEKMSADFASDPANLWAAIGPCIRECCYEVSLEVAYQFVRWNPAKLKANGKCQLNLVRANMLQLKAAGVPEVQIFDSGLCTFCMHETFYSFRRQPGETGRMIASLELL